MAEEETPLIPANNGQQSILSFLILLIIVGLLGLAFFFGLKFRNIPSETIPTPTPEVTIKPTEEITPTIATSTPTLTLTPTSNPTSTPTPKPTLTILKQINP
jgi:hypothetical protein